MGDLTMRKKLLGAIADYHSGNASEGRRILESVLTALQDPTPEITKAAALLMNTAGYQACSRNGKAYALYNAMIKAIQEGE